MMMRLGNGQIHEFLIVTKFVYDNDISLLVEHLICPIHNGRGSISTPLVTSFSNFRNRFLSQS